MAAGITPHEHKGIGAPIKAALTVVHNPSLPKCRLRKLAGKYTLRRPAMNKPSINQGAESKNRCQKLLSKSIDILQRR